MVLHGVRQDRLINGNSAIPVERQPEIAHVVVRAAQPADR